MGFLYRIYTGLAVLHLVMYIFLDEIMSSISLVLGQESEHFG